MIESGYLPVKSKIGEISDWEILPFVELMQFGDVRTVVVEVVKSPPASLFAVVAHPSGRFGATTVSNDSLYGNDVICADTSVTVKRNMGNILFMQD